MSNDATKPRRRPNWLLRHPALRKYLPLVHEDLTAVYARDLRKWLIIAPLIGLTTGLVITGIVVIILGKLWPLVLGYYLHHHWAIVPGVGLGFLITGLIMQFLTPDPDEHSTEEIVRSYHYHQGDVDMRPFFAKLLAAVTTVGFGGSAALEGPSIYGGGAIGSWLWAKLRRFNLEPRDRRIMLISGAAAGMAAVFRAPLTGLVFALEMPYRDDLAHEALLPSLIASVVSYVTLAFFLGATPIFDFASPVSFTGRDLIWCALLGLAIGLIAMTFAITFRRARAFAVKRMWPHWMKLLVGGVLTGGCGLLFVEVFKGSLVPRPELRGRGADSKRGTFRIGTHRFWRAQVGSNHILSCLGRSKRHVRAAVPYRRSFWNRFWPACSSQSLVRTVRSSGHGLVHRRWL